MEVLPLAATAAGFVLLLWSADHFVEGAAATARHLGVPALLIGIVIVGFGTSAPEMIVSAMAALDGQPDLALGNAFGSNIVNIGLILGVSALLAPITLHSRVVRKELPLLLAISLVAGLLLLDLALSRVEGLILLLGLFSLIGWSVFAGLRGRGDALEAEVEHELEVHEMSLVRALAWLLAALVLLLVSSRLLVWGAIQIAASLGISELVIGLTVVAIGTSLPELAASMIAARKGEHDIAVGNLIGSNMFNTLGVVGIATLISPVQAVAREFVWRDWLTATALTLGVFLMAYGFRARGRLTRLEGTVLLSGYIAYNAWLIESTMRAAQP